ncbi:uncharacterized protein At4g04775-like [Arabidopsis lyrata subsp. lyrata]|uniref:uncharacterized protein At4g04775-like n=1 Tax=Arabidopsis lyrata subsp. lyrata TaxID=81972 RepID=UPI000A29B5BF|nr:uncharacterized protein At4g04775-like [Arabidopsis lyrata subsp. lyrata]|eukprot:XP_020876486.1 uncharacterized protein At4g04775-like [Arabidopsis lyrata subsp. lyrata]
MSNSSGATSGASNGGHRRRIVGVPKICWCGASISAIISKSAANPYRRYYRCAYAASHKLIDDNHTFKWVDEALLDEIERLAVRTSALEQSMSQITTETMDHQKIVFERMQMKLEKEIFERVEEELLDFKSSMKKMSIAVIVGCMIMLGLSKMIG